MKENGRWRLTAQGFLLSNRIILALQEAQRESAAFWVDPDNL